MTKLHKVRFSYLVKVEYSKKIRSGAKRPMSQLQLLLPNVEESKRLISPKISTSLLNKIVAIFNNEKRVIISMKNVSDFYVNNFDKWMIIFEW